MQLSCIYNGLNYMLPRRHTWYWALRLQFIHNWATMSLLRHRKSNLGTSWATTSLPRLRLYFPAWPWSWIFLVPIFAFPGLWLKSNVFQIFHKFASSWQVGTYNHGPGGFYKHNVFYYCNLNFCCYTFDKQMLQMQTYAEQCVYIFVA